MAMNPYDMRDPMFGRGLDPSNPFNPGRSYSSKDVYIMRRYQELCQMAMEVSRGRDTEEVATALAIIDQTDVLHELNKNVLNLLGAFKNIKLEVPKMEAPDINITVIEDLCNEAMGKVRKISSEMSSVYK